MNRTASNTINMFQCYLKVPWLFKVQKPVSAFRVKKGIVSVDLAHVLAGHRNQADSTVLASVFRVPASQSGTVAFRYRSIPVPDRGTLIPEPENPLFRHFKNLHKSKSTVGRSVRVQRSSVGCRVTQWDTVQRSSAGCSVAQRGELAYRGCSVAQQGAPQLNFRKLQKGTSTAGSSVRVQRSSKG